MARGVRWQFGLLWACWALLTQAGCGDSSAPVDDQQPVERRSGEGSAADVKKNVGDGAAAPEDGGGDEALQSPGVTAGGGSFLPPGTPRPDDGELPSDAANQDHPPGSLSGLDSTGKASVSKPGKKSNPLRSPGPKPAEEAVPPAKPASDKGDDSPNEKPGETAKSLGGVDSPVAKPGQSRIAIFSGWSKPDAALVLTGRQNGYIEPCGCAGLVNQKGGMARRLTMIRELSRTRVAGRGARRRQSGETLRAAVRDQVPDRGFDGLRQMDYRVIGLGPDDLRLSSGELFAAASEEPYRFVSSNVTVLDPSVTPLFRVLEVGELKVGVTTVLGDEYRERVKSDEVSTHWPKRG